MFCVNDDTLFKNIQQMEKRKFGMEFEMKLRIKFEKFENYSKYC